VLSLVTNHHVILVGPSGAGKRTLVYSLALLIAEGKGPVLSPARPERRRRVEGPEGLKAVIEIVEAALLDNPPAAVKSGLRRAQAWPSVPRWPQTPEWTPTT